MFCEFREAREIKQSALKGLTERHLRRIEHGQIGATRSALAVLAQAHRMSLADYLAELAKRTHSSAAS